MPKKSSDADKRKSADSEFKIEVPQMQEKSNELSVNRMFLRAAVDVRDAVKGLNEVLKNPKQSKAISAGELAHNKGADTAISGGSDSKRKSKKKSSIKHDGSNSDQVTVVTRPAADIREQRYIAPLPAVPPRAPARPGRPAPLREKAMKSVSGGESLESGKKQKSNKKSSMKHVVNAAMLAVGTVSPTAGIGMAAKHADKKLNEDGVTKSLKGKKGSALKGLAALVSPTAAAGVFLESKRHTMIRKVDDATSMKELAGKTTQGMKKMFAKSPKKSDSENVAKPSKGALRR